MAVYNVAGFKCVYDLEFSDAIVAALKEKPTKIPLVTYAGTIRIPWQEFQGEQPVFLLDGTESFPLYLSAGSIIQILFFASDIPHSKYPVIPVTRRYYDSGELADVGAMRRNHEDYETVLRQLADTWMVAYDADETLELTRENYFDPTASGPFAKHTTDISIDGKQWFWQVERSSVTAFGKRWERVAIRAPSESMKLYDTTTRKLSFLMWWRIGLVPLQTMTFLNEYVLEQHVSAFPFSGIAIFDSLQGAQARCR